MSKPPGYGVLILRRVKGAAISGVGVPALDENHVLWASKYHEGTTFGEPFTPNKCARFPGVMSGTPPNYFKSPTAMPSCFSK